MFRKLTVVALMTFCPFSIAKAQVTERGKNCGPMVEEYQRLRASTDKADQEKLAAFHAERDRKFKVMETFHKTGKGLTEQEANDMLDCFGSPKGQRFVTRPVCIPEKPEDNCGVKDRWAVLLLPSVTSDQVKQTVEALLAKHDIRLPIYMSLDQIIKDGFFGATFFIEAPESIAKQLSEEKIVRYVYQIQLRKTINPYN